MLYLLDFLIIKNFIAVSVHIPLNTRISDVIGQREIIYKLCSGRAKAKILFDA